MRLPCSLKDPFLECRLASLAVKTNLPARPILVHPIGPLIRLRILSTFPFVTRRDVLILFVVAFT